MHEFKNHKVSNPEIINEGVHRILVLITSAKSKTLEELVQRHNLTHGSDNKQTMSYQKQDPKSALDLVTGARRQCVYSQYEKFK